MKKRPVCLIIRDGWGRGKEENSNAIFKAATPFTDQYEKNCPTTIIETSGLSVGLPAGYMETAKSVISISGLDVQFIRALPVLTNRYQTGISLRTWHSLPL